MRKQNEARAVLLKKEEELIERKEALAELGGTSYAGGGKEKPKEETPKEYAKRVMSGQI